MLQIRAAQAEDVGTILKLIRGWPNTSTNRWPPRPPSRTCCATASATTQVPLRCSPNGTAQPVGFALYFYNYSTWKGRPGIFLEDLFV